MATLFDLTGEALQLQQQINESAELLFSDDPDEAAAAIAELEALIAFESGNRRALDAKADAWCWVIDHMRAQAAARASHAQRLKNLATSAEQQADALQERLIAALQKVAPDETTWELPEHKITSRRSQAVEVAVEAVDLPEQFQRVKTTVSADKTALAAALKGGAQIEGASLVERRSWSIK
jgi:adenosylmethionine-8-amino-7-oxononanoate aminotransferase